MIYREVSKSWAAISGGEVTLSILTIIFLLAALTFLKMGIDSSAHLCGGEGEMTEWKWVTWKNLTVYNSIKSIVQNGLFNRKGVKS